MATSNKDNTIGRYTELAPAQMLDDTWSELGFDLAPGHELLRDFVIPEWAGGFVYSDCDVVGSATHNRFIHWRVATDFVELVEISTEVQLEGNQVRITFSNSPIVNDINVIEYFDSVVIVIVTSTSVHRLHLSHPKTTNKSIFSDFTTEILYNSANYYILNINGSRPSQQPICATAWQDNSTIKAAVSFPDSSILIVLFSKSSNNICTQEIKQIGIMGRLWLKMPNLITGNQNDCDNAVFNCYPSYQSHINDVLLFTLCRDFKIRVFSTNTRECLCTHNTISQTSFSQSFANHTNLMTDVPTIRIYKSHVILYLTEFKSEFVILEYNHEENTFKEKAIVQGIDNWEKLLSFSVTKSKIWALVNVRATEYSLYYTDISGLLGDNSETDNFVWHRVQLVDDYDMPDVKNFVAEIFWRNRFSAATIQKALAGIAGPNIPKVHDMEMLERIAFTKIVDDNQEEAWTRFYNYCIQNHQVSNKILGLFTNQNEDVAAIVKRSSSSIICPWFNTDDSYQSQRDVNGPYHGIDFSSALRAILGPLHSIHNDILTENWKSTFERKLSENPSNVLSIIEDLTNNIMKSKSITANELNINHKQIPGAISYLCQQLDITSDAHKYSTKIMNELNSKMRSDFNPLASNSGISIIFESFRQIVRARMLLCRDLLIYIYFIGHFIDPTKHKAAEKHIERLHLDLFTSGKVARIANALRSYAILVWITETPIKGQTTECNSKFIEFVAKHFKFFTTPSSPSIRFRDTPQESSLRRNLFTNFLANGGINFVSPISEISDLGKSLSNSQYALNTSLNLCRLLWPMSNHICFMEYLFTHNLDDYLSKYDELIADWVDHDDRLFVKACNCILQNRAVMSVDMFGKLWPTVTRTNLAGSFIGLQFVQGSADKLDLSDPKIIDRYYDKLIQMFQIINNVPCLVKLINQCMSLLDDSENPDQSESVNCYRAKLFQYYLELDEIEEAYHCMVTTTDSNLRTNCLRKFIVCLCDKEQWLNLISYPFIDIKDEFIEILVQKADSSDLSMLTDTRFYKTSYYDLLFSFHISYDEYEKAAHIMYHYAQRLALEVPGIVSIRKQVDCLLVALNTLRCEPEGEAYIEYGSKAEGRTSVTKRHYDGESEKVDDEGTCVQYIGCKDIKLKYELTRARLKLLDKDQTANAIALSPLQPDETISQLVSCSMIPEAMELAILFKTSMDSTLEGLASKYVFISRLSSIDITMHQDLDKDLSDIFTSTYGTIDTYNFVANSTASFVDKLWRLIDYYLNQYDGIGHRYENDDLAKSFKNTTLLIKVVAVKLLLSGHDIPASMVRMYRARNSAELLKLLMKYDKLQDAANFATEMINLVLKPDNALPILSSSSSDEPPPIYLPTHLIMLLIAFLEEDATNTTNLKTARSLSDKLDKYRSFVTPQPV